VLGYFYKKALEREIEEDFVGDANPVGYTNPNERSDYLYKPADNAPAAPAPRRF
jgi:hypothetical protein